MTASDASDQRNSATRGPLTRLYEFSVSPVGFFTIVLVYIAAHILQRLWISPVLGTDEIEQALFARDWRLGYNPRQPPLYTWLLVGAYQVFGRTLLAHLIVKYGVLAAMFAASYATGRRLLKSPQTAALATYALVLLYNIGWGAHTGYTHSLLLSVFIFLSIWAASRAFESERLFDYVVLGVVIGLGFLTKFSFAIFLAPLLLGCCFAAPLRRGFLNWRTPIALLIAVSILVVPVNWMIHAPYPYVGALREVAGVAQHSSYIANVGQGLLSLIEGPITFLAPFWIAALMFWPSFRKPAAASRPWLKAMAMALALTVVLLVAFVFVAQVTDFKPRYLHPILLTAPLLFFLWLDQRPRNPNAERWLAGVAALFVLGVFGALMGQALLEPRDCKNCWLQMPMPALAGDLRRDDMDHGTILAADAHIGGNLQLFLPEARVLTPAYPMVDAAPTGRGQCLLIWDARIRGPAPPPSLTEFLTEHFGGAPPNGPTDFVTEPLLRGGARTDSFGVMRVTGRTGDCLPT